MVQSLGRGTWNRFLGIAAAAAFLAGCGGSSSSTPPAPVLVLIGVSPASPTLAPGAAQQLTATGKYSDATTKDLTSQVTWASSDATVAAVSAGGLVTAGAITGGTAGITATLGEQVGFAQVKVGEVPVLVLIGVSPASPSLAPGAAQQLTATGKYSDATTKDLTSQVTWASSDARVATVSAAGLATAGTLTGGATVVSATLGEQVGFTQLSVTGAELYAIRLFPAAVSEPVGVGTSTHVFGRYTDDTERDLTSLASYTIDDPTLATVTAGKVRGVAVGSTKVSASVAGLSVSGDVAITGATIDYLAVGPMDTPKVATGRTEGFTAIAEYWDGANYTYFDVTADATWESDDTTVVSFAPGSSPGQATAVAAGSANVTATFDSMTSYPQVLTVADGLTDYTESQIPFSVTPMADATPVLAADDGYAALPSVPDFTFAFYGTSYTTDQIYVTSNGNINFDWGSSGYPGGPYPNAYSGEPAAVIYGADLVTSVTYKVLGAAPNRQLVLDWQGAFYGSETELVHLQMVLHEGTNLIDFQYIEVGAQYGVNAEIGLQNQDGMLGTEHSYYDYLVVPGLAIRYSP